MIKTDKRKVLFLKEEYGEGQGLFIFDDSCRYEGEWKDGKFHGNGTLSIPEGDAVEGEWKNGELEGHGRFISSDGTKYV